MREICTGVDNQACKILNQHHFNRFLSINKYQIYLVARKALREDSENERTIPGHVFIGGITPDNHKEAYGFYPSKLDVDLLIESDNVEKQKGKIDKNDISLFNMALSGDSDYSYMVMNVNQIQYDKVITYMKTYASSNDYGLFTNNCVHASLRAIKNGGIFIGIDIPSPALPNVIAFKIDMRKIKK